MVKIKTSRTESSIVGVKNLKDGEDISHFFKKFHESELSRDFGVYRLSLDTFRTDIQQYVIEHGLSSMFYSYMACDSIMHPGFKTDEIEAIVLGIMSKLEIITLITHGKRVNMRPAMHNVFRMVVHGIQINDVVTDNFHDRYWIDFDSTHGVMVGTSLNGIGKKIAMIDYANSADSREIVRLASGFI